MPLSASTALEMYLLEAETQLPMMLADKRGPPAAMPPQQHELAPPRRPLGQLQMQPPLPPHQQFAAAMMMPPNASGGGGAMMPPHTMPYAPSTHLPPPSYRIQCISKEPDYVKQLERYDSLLDEVAQEYLGRPRGGSAFGDASPEAATKPEGEDDSDAAAAGDKAAAVTKLERTSKKLAAMKARHKATLDELKI